jgi:ABC-2 type transport system ATP-binding protein
VTAGRTAQPGGTSVDAAERLLAELPAAPAVWCSGLRKRYRRQTAVDGVSFTVGRGEVLGLLGPNGAGKTSVIKILLGLVRPDAGEVLVLGRPAGNPQARARVGYLPELFRYQPWLTAAEVLALHVRLAGAAVPAGERHECLELVGLLLALKEAGVAVLLNSHLIGEVERVCDRVVILDKGRVAASGTLPELLGRRELRMRLDGVSAPAEARLAAAGELTHSGDSFTVTLPAEHDTTTVPDLVADLVGLGVRVHAVEPGRISLEERLLDILRAGAGGDRR